MLYVGMLERPYIDLRNRVMATFAGLAALCVLLLLGLLSFIARRITRPLAVMVASHGPDRPGRPHRTGSPSKGRTRSVSWPGRSTG